MTSTNCTAVPTAQITSLVESLRPALGARFEPLRQELRAKFAPLLAE